MFRARLRQFLDKYSPNRVLSSLQQLLENLIENVRSSTSITGQAILAPVLLVLIGLLYPIVLLRRLLANLVTILRNLYRLIHQLFSVALQEINAYWSRTRREGGELLKYLRAATQKMTTYVQYLVDSIVEGKATYNSSVDISNRELIREITVRFVRWLGFGLLSTIMSILLFATFIVGIPLLHRRITGNFPEPRPQDSEPSVTIINS